MSVLSNTAGRAVAGTHLYIVEIRVHAENSVDDASQGEPRSTALAFLERPRHIKVAHAACDVLLDLVEVLMLKHNAGGVVVGQWMRGNRRDRRSSRGGLGACSCCQLRDIHIELARRSSLCAPRSRA